MILKQSEINFFWINTPLDDLEEMNIYSPQSQKHFLFLPSSISQEKFFLKIFYLYSLFRMRKCIHLTDWWKRFLKSFNWNLVALLNFFKCRKSFALLLRNFTNIFFLIKSLFYFTKEDKPRILLVAEYWCKPPYILSWLSCHIYCVLFSLHILQAHRWLNSFFYSINFRSEF